MPTNDRPTPISPRNGQAVIIIGPPTKGPEGVEVPAAAVGISATAALDLRARAFERAHDMVALHALRLVDSQSDTLHVVIKPGAGMQLSLELRQRGDAVDAQVVLQRGDFDALSQHWPELQQRLEQRGIRLAPLTGSENSATDASGQGFQKQQQGFENPDPISATSRRRPWTTASSTASP